MNTKIDFLYRNADNYKMYNECVVEGTLAEDEVKEIISCCDCGEYFIPSQIGLSGMRFSRFDPEVDHCWFELDESGFSATNMKPTENITANELLEAFRKAKGNWNEEKALEDILSD